MKTFSEAYLAVFCAALVGSNTDKEVSTGVSVNIAESIAKIAVNRMIQAGIVIDGATVPKHWDITV